MSKAIKPGGSILAARSALAAAVLSPELVVLKNIPQHPKLKNFLELLNFLGVTVTHKKGELTVDTSRLNTSAVPANLADKNAYSQILMGPLLARLQKAAWPQLNAKLTEAFSLLGLKISQEDGYTVLENRVDGGSVTLPEKDDLLTLALTFTSVNAQNKVVLQNAAQSPEVDDSVELLTKMGASVKRESDGSIVIQPVKPENLEFTEHRVINDRHAAVHAICQTLSKGAEAKIEGVNAKHLTAFLSKLDAVGISYKVTDKVLSVWIEDPAKIKPLEIDPKPYPGFEKAWLNNFVRMIETCAN